MSIHSSTEYLPSFILIVFLPNSVNSVCICVSVCVMFWCLLVDALCKFSLLCVFECNRILCEEREKPKSGWKRVYWIVFDVVCFGELTGFGSWFSRTINSHLDCFVVGRHLWWIGAQMNCQCKILPCSSPTSNPINKQTNTRNNTLKHI